MQIAPKLCGVLSKCAKTGGGSESRMCLRFPRLCREGSLYGLYRDLLEKVSKEKIKATDWLGRSGLQFFPHLI